MNRDKRKDLKESGKGLALETVLTVGSDTAADIAKESITSIVGDMLVDSASSLIPGVSGAVQGYKRARFERNIRTFTEELHSKIEEIRVNLEHKTDQQKEKIDQLFNFVMDYVIDEQQEDKIQYMVNGFVNITEHEQVSDDFILTYYDVLKELRMVDISVLRLMYSSRFIFDQEARETFHDVMERHGISYEQYESVRRNLLRIGLLTTKTDLNITDDLDEIVKKFKELHTYLDKLTNPRYKGSLPKLKEPKLKSKENLEMSKFGRDFVRFFLDLDKE
ncbi:hypothetical protein [Falsibacillus pallidus]|uniref:Uncharacterized protein n=1 Tax=Falsibacillus pallidus TaxID=493781 RepID=A0A370GL14_9BACI|nr:hypothetical protein [Falsibacillus pallidus]RDI44050.1 hypothetical protein DFR59_103113 [Falsibacillus pallidus]